MMRSKNRIIHREPSMHIAFVGEKYSTTLNAFDIFVKENKDIISRYCGNEAILKDGTIITAFPIDGSVFVRGLRFQQVIWALPITTDIINEDRKKSNIREMLTDDVPKEYREIMYIL